MVYPDVKLGVHQIIMAVAFFCLLFGTFCQDWHFLPDLLVFPTIICYAIGVPATLFHGLKRLCRAGYRGKP